MAGAAEPALLRAGRPALHRGALGRPDHLRRRPAWAGPARRCGQPASRQLSLRWRDAGQRLRRRHLAAVVGDPRDLRHERARRRGWRRPRDRRRRRRARVRAWSATRPRRCRSRTTRCWRSRRHRPWRWPARSRARTRPAGADPGMGAGLGRPAQLRSPSGSVVRAAPRGRGVSCGPAARRRWAAG